MLTSTAGQNRMLTLSPRSLPALALLLISTSFERGLATGDSNVASENLRRFFEQHFHEGNDSSVSP
jgi:hypothetical protein